jgi:hypothetical protein
MILARADRLGPYEIVAVIGVGGGIFSKPKGQPAPVTRMSRRSSGASRGTTRREFALNLDGSGNRFSRLSRTLFAAAGRTISLQQVDEGTWSVGL